MTLREGLLVLLTVAAALIAAVRFRVASNPAEIHAPVFAGRFEATRRVLPLVGAVRVRSLDPMAAHRLQNGGRGAFESVLDPQRATALFRYGRLLYATPAEVDRILRRAREGELPASLPELPDLSGWFRDREGSYACDVIPRTEAAVTRIREILPGARLTGEPVARVMQADELEALPRALLLALALAGLWIGRRAGTAAALHRLLAALVPLALLAWTGWGADVWTVPALALVLGTGNGASLFAGLACLFFPSLALRRVGFVLVVGGLVRWGRLERRGEGGPSAALVALAVLLLGAGVAWRAWPVEVTAHPAVRPEPAVALADKAAASKLARRLREEGVRGVQGGENPLPADPDAVTRRKLRQIFQLAREQTAKASETLRPRWEELSEAAATDSLYLRAPLRERLRARDGRYAVWVCDDVALERTEFTGARLHRLRGRSRLRSESRLATMLSLALAALLLGRVHGRRAWLAIGVRAAGLAAGLAVLAAFAPLPETWGPLLVVAGLAPGIPGVLALAGAAGGLLGPYLWPCLALLACAGSGWLADRVTRPR